MRKIFPSLFLSFILLLTAACSEDDPITPQHEHAEAVGMALLRDGAVVASILRGVPGDTLRVDAGVTSEDFDVWFYDADDDLFEEHDDDKIFSWQIADPTLVEVVQEAGKEGKFEFRLKGLRAGSTSIEFFIMHEGHADFRTGAWPVQVQ